ncbi:MAG TPA: peptidase E [Solirubrobacteraceae bacterium]|nr:peptidase E [Solirubrobacteraceae bacterium]
MAIGGGGFGSTGRDHALDAYIAELAGPDRPQICLLPTASGDPKEQITRFNGTFRRLGCSPSHLALFRLGDQPEVEVREHLLAQDAIYVGGGSLANLLAIWRTHGLDEVLREAWEAGILLCGVSAGSMCWFQAGITRSHGEPRPTAGLGFLEGSNCVHYANDTARRPAYHEAMRGGTLPGGWGVPDGTALVFEGTRLVEAVTARPGCDAYRVDLVDGEVVETVCRARVLEDRDPEHLEPDPALAEFRAQRRRASDLAGGSRVAVWRHASAEAAEVRRAGRG